MKSEYARRNSIDNDKEGRRHNKNKEKYRKLCCKYRWNEERGSMMHGEMIDGYNYIYQDTIFLFFDGMEYKGDL